MPGGVGIIVVTLSFDEGDIVSEFDRKFDVVLVGVGWDEVRSCLIHFPFPSETVPSFMASFVAVRAGNVGACPTSSSPSFAFGIGSFVWSRFPLGFVVSISFGPGFTFPFVLPFSFPRGMVVGWTCFDITKFLALFGGVIRVRVENTGF